MPTKLYGFPITVKNPMQRYKPPCKFWVSYRVGIAINHITFHHGRTGSEIGYFSLCGVGLCLA